MPIVGDQIDAEPSRSNVIICKFLLRVHALRHPRFQDSVLFSMDICDTYIPERLTKPSNIVIFFSVDHDCVFNHSYMCLSLLHDFPFVHTNIFIGFQNCSNSGVCFVFHFNSNAYKYIFIVSFTTLTYNVTSLTLYLTFKSADREYNIIDILITYFHPFHQ